MEFPITLSATSTCDCPSDFVDFIAGDPTIGALTSGTAPGLYFVLDDGSCSTPVPRICVGPLTFKATVKLVGFIKFSASYKVPDTQFCDRLDNL